MLFLICYTLLRRYSNSRKHMATKISGFLNVCAARLSATLFIGFVMLLIPNTVVSQASLYNYKVMYRGDVIGWMKLEKNINGNKSDLSLVSEIKTRVIVPVRVYFKEMSTFEDGKLVFSSQFQKANGKIKTDKQTKLVSDKYEITENGEHNMISSPLINTNLLSLFFDEPLAVNYAYSEKQQRFLKIVKSRDGGYELKFPNGNKNCFYYSKGICTKIKVAHNLYAVEVILTP